MSTQSQMFARIQTRIDNMKNKQQVAPAQDSIVAAIDARFMSSLTPAQQAIVKSNRNSISVRSAIHAERTGH